ncbi:hypothetical protein SEA_PARADIDDLES_127 [Streptomyces phage Paradiddles]|uniref:Uncharacterized protein n=3 Tax=Samistivirus TaxID=2560220 RepID=A0A514U207_9CAUD|nr:hypothetical protein FDI36_gp136 [Streptomyces phage NootNoot]YP_009611112.1 hypothetical protein FDI37_gp133 [Streptomyces phage Paradiddles]YP_010104015.1 hypothetical protein KNU71_gp141 [Streptomyces phage Braelyn]UGL63121.1 hypothetical protein SEA_BARTHOLOMUNE_131 [Streptomyces phage Bartholomune]UOW93553.1 hypothetical protein SEA_SQUILLIUM_131 [Streptomyces phage Squillium]WNM73385.1 hypothetical protein SEA_LIANDRY_131 [Streptomyces phage Liandry]WNM74783.1 hypothetical protein SE
MAYYPINQFFYDSETNNIIVQFAVYTEKTYETAEMDDPYDVIEAELFLDAGKFKIGEYRPAALDGSVTQEFIGRDLGQAPSVTPPNPVPEEPA